MHISWDTSDPKSADPGHPSLEIFHKKLAQSLSYPILTNTAFPTPFCPGLASQGAQTARQACTSSRTLETPSSLILAKSSRGAL